MVDLSGNMIRQVEQNLPLEDDGSHIANIGKVSMIGASITIYMLMWRILDHRDNGIKDEESFA